MDVGRVTNGGTWEEGKWRRRESFKWQRRGRNEDGGGGEVRGERRSKQ